MKQLKVAIYTRVSTDDQDPEKQRMQCEEYCQRNPNFVKYGCYQDIYSGAKDSRPGLNQLLHDMRAYKFDAIMVTKLDRIGRSLQHLLSLFDEFKGKGIHFIATTQNIDTSSPAGMLQLHMIGAFAEFERAMISERTKEGLKHSKNKHKIGKRGKDKKPRKKRGVLKKPLLYLNEGAA
jgi:DNA invertase Pin-like site-specific DNA recombinase